MEDWPSSCRGVKAFSSLRPAASAPQITSVLPSASPINRLLAGCPPHFLSRTSQYANQLFDFLKIRSRCFQVVRDESVGELS